MKIVFVSNFMSHHQLPLSQELIRQNTDGQYTFVALKRMNAERISLGYDDMNVKYDFVLRAYESEEQDKQARELITQADAVIWGSADYDYLAPRLDAGKLTFRYSERIFRNGKWTLLKPANRAYFHRCFGQYAQAPFYLLAAGAYASSDYSFIHAFPRKALKWGYFPPLEKKAYTELLQEKQHGPFEIIWCARLIALKHPESVLYMARKLRQQKIDFHVTMVGNGELLEDIRAQAKKEGLDDYVSLPGSVPADRVRAYMDRAKVLLFTSDAGEGWGAVLNEGMNSACVPVVSHAIGSAPYLVKHQENGFIFESKNWNEMTERVQYLIQNPDAVNAMSRAAYQTIQEQWNAEKAAENLLRLCRALLDSGKEVLPAEGPCSRAEDMKPSDVKKAIRRRKQ